MCKNTDSFPEIIIGCEASDRVKRAGEYFEKQLFLLPQRLRRILLAITEADNPEYRHSYRISGARGEYAITGNDEDALLVGMKRFLSCAADRGFDSAAVDDVGHFGDEIRIFENLVMWELKSKSVIEQPPADQASATMKYCSLIELNSQPVDDHNGILVATGERYIDDYLCPIYRSTDKGATWELVTLISDPFHPGIRTTFAPCLFELPRQIGEMPAGTLILGSNSVNSSWDEGYVVLYRSFDAGLTWEGFTVVAGGKAHDGEFGVWEPYFVVTDDGELICYYSDDFDTYCSQTLVYKSSRDGVRWSEQKTVVRLTAERDLRPGMPVVVRLADKRYVLVYEIVCLPGNPLYYKISDNALNWGDTDERGILIQAGAKSLAATPWAAVNEQGMLVVTGWRMAAGKSNTGSDIFVSFDSGESFTAVDNFYSYKWNDDRDTWGYSACVTFSSDGKTMYYMANPCGEKYPTTHFTLFTIEIS